MADKGTRIVLATRVFPTRSRPLRTGKEFDLVLPQRQRVIVTTWDKLEYDPGNAAELILKGEHLDEELPLEIETLEETGHWQPLAHAKAKPREHGAEARAPWKIPEPRKQKLPTIVEATWAKDKVQPGEELVMQVRTHDLDGGHLIWLIERQDARGAWVKLDTWDAVVEKNKAERRWKVPAERRDAGPSGRLIEASFAKMLKDRMALAVTADGFDGAAVQFILERQSGSPEWSLIGTASANVKSGSASVELPLRPGARKGQRGALLEASFDGSPDSLVVKAMDLDGEGVEMIVEQQQKGLWIPFAWPEAKIAKGVARARVKLPFEKNKVEGQLVSARFSEAPHEIHVTALRLDGIGLRYTVEKWDGTHWNYVAEGRGKIQDGQAISRVEVPGAKLLQLPPQLVSARFLEAPVSMEATAERMEGAQVTLSVERFQNGKWAEVGKDEVKFQRGRAVLHLPQASPTKPVPVVLATHVDAIDGRHASLRAQTFGLDGQKLDFVLERNDGGQWTQVGSATSSIAKGAAQTKIQIADSKHGPEDGLLATRFDEAPTSIAVTTNGLEGQKLDFVVERLDGSEWVEAGSGSATVAHGEASLDLPDAGPDGDLPDGSVDEAHFEDAPAVVAASTTDLDGEQLDFVLERCDAGAWSEVATGKATVKEGAVRAELPLPEDEEEPEGHLLDTSVDGTSLDVRAEGMDGVQAEVVLEKLEGGEWVPKDKQTATIADGAAHLDFEDATDAGDFSLSEMSIEAAAKAVHLSVGAPGLDGQKLDFVLEKNEGGNWIEAGRAAATVAEGKAVVDIGRAA